MSDVVLRPDGTMTVEDALVRLHEAVIERLSPTPLTRQERVAVVRAYVEEEMRKSLAAHGPLHDFLGALSPETIDALVEQIVDHVFGSPATLPVTEVTATVTVALPVSTIKVETGFRFD